MKPWMVNQQKALWLALFFGVTVLLPGLASSTTYCVSCTGNDANNGYRTRSCTVK